MCLLAIVIRFVFSGMKLLLLKSQPRLLLFVSGALVLAALALFGIRHSYLTTPLPGCVRDILPPMRPVAKPLNVNNQRAFSVPWTCAQSSSTARSGQYHRSGFVLMAIFET